MKFALLVIMSMFLFGCGTISSLHPYIQREVKSSELVGVWKVTHDSEAAMNAYAKEALPHWYGVAPWMVMTLHEGGKCEIVLEPNWVGDNWFLNVSSTIPVAGVSNPLARQCSWKVGEHYAEDLRKSVPAVYVTVPVLHPGITDGRDELGFFIYEDRGTLTLWTWIGKVATRPRLNFRLAQP